MHNRRIVLTNDGSHTVYDPVLKSNFHSIHGAITESKHVFIQNGLEYVDKSKAELNIFEFGFGTGLNAFLSFLYSQTNTIKINYNAIESIPLDFELAKELNYPELLSANLNSNFLEFHTCQWNIPNALSSNFYLKKINCNWELYNETEKFDLVFFDAFDPVAQPELWSISSFQKLCAIMNDNAILCTYCAKGIVRRNLKEVGFKIESLSGPPGKREMTRAFKGG